MDHKMNFHFILNTHPCGVSQVRLPNTENDTTAQFPEGNYSLNGKHHLNKKHLEMAPLVC